MLKLSKNGEKILKFQNILKVCNTQMFEKSLKVSKNMKVFKTWSREKI